MTDFITAQPGILEAAIQGLLECRSKARSIEQFADSLGPLLDVQKEGHAAELVGNIRETSAKLQHWLKTLYDRNARDVFQVRSEGG